MLTISGLREIRKCCRRNYFAEASCGNCELRSLCKNFRHNEEYEELMLNIKPLNWTDINIERIYAYLEAKAFGKDKMDDTVSIILELIKDADKYEVRLIIEKLEAYMERLEK